MSLPMPKFFGSRTNRGSVGSLTVLAAIFALMAAGTAAAFFFVGCRSEEKRNARVSYWNALWNTKNDEKTSHSRADGLGLRENCAQSGTQKRPPRDLSLFLTERASDARVFYNAFSERVSSLATLFPSTSRAQMYARFGRAHREHHLTKKREKTRILTTTTAKQILPRPPKRDSNRAPRWRPSYFAPSLSREKKNNDAPSFLFFFASKRQRTLPQHNFVERESFYYCRERETLIRGGQKGLKNI